MTNRHRAIVVSGVVFLFGCGLPNLPTEPSSLEEGIAIYEHTDFLGESAHIVKDIENLKDFSGPCNFVDYDALSVPDTFKDWGDCLSSIRVSPGWRAVLYRNDGFDGEHLELSGDHSNLKLASGPCRENSFNDCVSSIRVFPP